MPETFVPFETFVCIFVFTNNKSNIMKLSNRAIEAITQPVRLKLALALGFTETWIAELMRANKVNGPLTTYAAIKTISEESGLSQDEILESEQEHTTAA